jgi:hypothetical protein
VSVDGAIVIAIDFALLERIAEQRRFEARTLEIAKRLFIHGEQPKRLSLEYGVNLQRIYAIRAEVLAAAKAAALPSGWKELNLVGPAELIDRLKAEFDRNMAERGDHTGATSHLSASAPRGGTRAGRAS